MFGGLGGVVRKVWSTARSSTCCATSVPRSRTKLVSDHRREPLVTDVRSSEHDHKPLGCRTGHHDWTETHLDSGEVHRQAAAAARTTTTPRTRSDGFNVLGALAQGFGNAGTGG